MSRSRTIVGQLAKRCKSRLVVMAAVPQRLTLRALTALVAQQTDARALTTEAKDSHQSCKSVAVIVPTLNSANRIPELIMSIYNQDYRPIETIVVDGGSRDNTVDVTANLQETLRSHDFKIEVLRESDFGQLRSPANARNIGVLNTASDYLMFFDADFELTDRSLVSEVHKKLVEYPVVRVNVIPAIETWIEFHCAIDDLRTSRDVHIQSIGGYRREILTRTPFDPRLGFGEDRDFALRLEVSPAHLHAYCHRHYVHTLRDWRKQALWYGRTFPRFLEKYWNRIDPRELWINPYAHLAYYIGGPALLVLILAGKVGLLSSTVVPVGLGLFLVKLLYHYLRSPKRQSWRLLYIILRETYYNFWFTVGLVISQRSHAKD